MELHTQIREARKQAKLTQVELAQMANVGRMDISRLENGENVTMKTFIKIVNALPNLTELRLGSVNLKRDKDQPAGESRDDVRTRAAELLSGMPRSAAAAATPDQATRREQSLIRMFAELLMEITGSRNLD